MRDEIGTPFSSEAMDALQLAADVSLVGGFPVPLAPREKKGSGSWHGVLLRKNRALVAP